MIPVSNKTRSITRIGYKHPGFWRQENTITILTLSPGVTREWLGESRQRVHHRQEAKARQRILPTWPVPPGITIFIVGNPHSPTSLCVNHNGQQLSARRCMVPGGTTHLIRRSGFERAIRRRVLQAAVKLDALAVSRVLDNSRAPRDT